MTHSSRFMLQQNWFHSLSMSEARVWVEGGQDGNREKGKSVKKTDSGTCWWEEKASMSRAQHCPHSQVPSHLHRYHLPSAHRPGTATGGWGIFLWGRGWKRSILGKPLLLDLSRGSNFTVSDSKCPEFCSSGEVGGFHHIVSTLETVTDASG